jgi:hypothetical protein
LVYSSGIAAFWGAHALKARSTLVRSKQQFLKG